MTLPDKCDLEGCHRAVTLYGPTGNFCRIHAPLLCVRCGNRKPRDQLTPCGPRHHACDACWEGIIAAIQAECVRCGRSKVVCKCDPIVPNAEWS